MQISESDLPWVNVPSVIRKGRNLSDGYRRGMAIQFSQELCERIASDPLYKEARHLIEGRSLLVEANRMNLFLLIKLYLRKLPFGHIVEFGAYKGGNALFMALLAKQCLPGVQVYAFDTFAGMPSSDAAVDMHGPGDFSDVDLGELIEYARSLGVDNLHPVKGLFEDTAPEVLPGIGRLALCHIDCDILSAVLYSYRVTKPYMVPGAYWVFDDALVSSCLGATEAVEEIIQRDRIFSEQTYPHWVFRSGLG